MQIRYSRLKLSGNHESYRLFSAEIDLCPQVENFISIALEVGTREKL